MTNVHKKPFKYRFIGFLKELMVKDSTNFIQHVYFKIKLTTWWKLYKKIANKDGVTYLCPYKGTGDVFVATVLLASQIGEDRVKRSKVCVIGEGSRKVVLLSGFTDVMALEQEEMDDVMRMGTALGFAPLDLFVLHADPPNSKMGITDHLRNYNGINFMDFFVSGVFNNPGLNVKVPAFDECKDSVKKFFDDNGLIPGRTVIVAPYVNTLGELPVWLWIEIVDEFRKRGYTVCTNCDDKHWPIFGSVRVNPSYAELKEFYEYAGYFVGSRSGLCDILSSFDMCKIIIYLSTEQWGSGEIIDFFSMNDMGLCEDAIEIVHKGIDFLTTKDEILRRVQGWERSHGGSKVPVNTVR
ncbi:MAG: hypothetical protein IKH98_00250 [Candidatus Methanomethylophilaceae archaeon]|nr:hypothetical protein [Candidatus Methanomethylophilaceae archaeon]